LLGGQPAIVSALTSAKNITILAPSNAAFAAFLNTTDGAAAATKSDVVAALLEYHVLGALYPASAFTAKAQFLPTLLSNASYTNVTGGQRVKAVLDGKNVNIISGLLKKSTVVVAVSLNILTALNLLNLLMLIISSKSNTDV
jgi:transforming growth factor-beta-induced protein